MNINSARRRKAISPVLATVILIAITLIAAIAIAGFVFGLFGSFTSTARVSFVYASLKGAGAAPTGFVNFQNTGTSNVNGNSMTLTYGGQTCNAGITAAAITAGAAPASFTIGATCTTAAASGEAFVGSLALSNGGQIPFSGVFS